MGTFITLRRVAGPYPLAALIDPVPEGVKRAIHPVETMTNMKIETGKIDHPLQITEELRLDGMAVAGVTVLPGSMLLLNGTVFGDVVVLEGASAEVNGTVHGDLINRGGEIELRGTLHGSVRTESGTTRVDPEAVIASS